MNVLITAGPTREPMDPVRFLTNASSGAMGFAFARAFRAVRAKVTVVCGPVPGPMPSGFRVVPIVTARDMDRAVQKRLPSCDVLIATAAVGDFRFQSSSQQKIKKGRSQTWRVTLVKNPDVLKNAGLWRKRKKSNRPLLVGFALETSRLSWAMASKLKDKNLDLIIGNSPASFSGDAIKPTWLERGGRFKRFPRMSKLNLAKNVVRWVNNVRGK